MNAKRELVIMSGYCNAEGIDRGYELVKELKFPAKEVQGVYKGVMETSYAIVLHEPFEDNEPYFLDLLKKYKQECLLYVSACNQAYFVNQSGERVFMGVFHSAPKSEALRHDGYTYDKFADMYWVIDKDREF